MRKNNKTPYRKFFKNKTVKYGLTSLAVTLSLCQNIYGTESAENIEILNDDLANQISKGIITLEGNKVDNTLYNQPALSPNADDDNDGVLNKFEIYIYSKNGRKYYGYNSHPKLKDTDGDGIHDNEDKKPLEWDISDRDMALFMELAYREDAYINKVLDELNNLDELYDGRQEYAMMHKELAPFWKVKTFYHLDGGFDAILLETKSNFPYLKDNTVQVLAIRGTQGGKDYDDDIALSFGGDPGQAKVLMSLLRRLDNDQSIDNLYVTGHSLGGYLAMRAGIEALDQGYEWLKKVYTFNAPKIKGLSSWAKNLAKRGDSLTESGKARHFKTDNDLIINPVGAFNGAISIGRSERGHSSRTYFLPQLNGTHTFSVGDRYAIDGSGYKDPNLDNVANSSFTTIKSIDAEDISTSQIVRFDDDTSSIDLASAVADENNVKDRVTFTDITDYTNVKLNEAGQYTATLRVTHKFDNSQKDVEVPVRILPTSNFEEISLLGVDNEANFNKAVKDNIEKLINKLSANLDSVTISAIEDNFQMPKLAKTPFQHVEDESIDVTLEYTLDGVKYTHPQSMPIKFHRSTVDPFSIEDGDEISSERVKTAVKTALNHIAVLEVGTIPDTFGEAGKTLQVPVKVRYYNNDALIENLIVPVNVIERSRPLSETHHPNLKNGGQVITNENDIVFKEAVLNLIVDLPDLRLLDGEPVITIPSDNSVGTRNATVEYRFIDNSTYTIPVPIVYENIPDNEQFDPVINEITITEHDSLTPQDIKDAITETKDFRLVEKIVLDDIPTSIGLHQVRVSVKYGDDTIETVSVPINIKPVADNQKYNPHLIDENTVVKALSGENPPVEFIVNKITDIPENSTVETIFPDDTSVGKRVATVTITYTDNTSDTVEVPINYVELEDKTERTPIKFETTYVENENLDYNTSNTKTQGVDGYDEKITSYKIDYATDTIVEKSVTSNHITPTNEVIEKGTKPTITTEEVPFTTVYERNDDMNFGDEQVITNGKNGSKTTTTTYSLDTETGVVTANEPTVKNVAPTNKVVQKGTKPTITETPIQFKTVYLASDDLDFGTQRTKTDGQNGVSTSTTTYTLDENTGIVSDNEPTVVETKPTDEVIEKGTKPTISTEEVPFTTVYERNDDMNFGDEQVVTNGKNGSKTTTTTYSLDTETGVVTANEPTVKNVAPTNKVVQKGTKPTITETPIQFKTVYLASDDLDFSTQRTKTDGQNGVSTSTTTYTLDENTGIVSANEPTVVETKPTDEVIEKGTKPTITTEEVPFTTVYERNDDMNFGDEQVVTNGKNGSKTTTTTYSLDTETGIVTANPSTVVISNPTNKVVAKGTKPKETIDILPHDTVNEVLENEYTDFENTIEGRDGQIISTTVYELDKLTGEVTEGQTTTKRVEPVSTIKQTGSKQIRTEETTTTIREIPFDTIFVEDAKLTAGEEKVVVQGVMGAENIHTTTTYIKGVAQPNPTVVVETTTQKVDQVVHRNTGSTYNEKDIVIQSPIVYQADDTLAFGERRTVQGEDGTLKQTLDNKNVVIAEEKIKEPTDTIIYIGTKPNIITTYSDFETETIQKPDMDKGTKEVFQQGVKGSKTVTTTYTVDSQTGEIAVNEHIDIVEPIKEIIYIGTKEESSDPIEDNNKTDNDNKEDIEIINPNDLNSGDDNEVNGKDDDNSNNNVTPNNQDKEKEDNESSNEQIVDVVIPTPSQVTESQSNEVSKSNETNKSSSVSTADNRSISTILLSSVLSLFGVISLRRKKDK